MAEIEDASSRGGGTSAFAPPWVRTSEPWLPPPDAGSGVALRIQGPSPRPPTPDQPAAGRGPRPRRRHKDGLGKGENSHGKHEYMRELVGIQAARLAHLYPPNLWRGAVIDMHAGDGKGVETPQGGLFGQDLSPCSPTIADAVRRRHLCDMVLCESRFERRRALIEAYPEAMVLHTNRLLPELAREAGWHWIVVMNDPCGPAKAAVEVMQALEGIVRRSDFIVVVNRGAIERVCGLRDADQAPPASGANARLVEAARASKDKYAWMLEPYDWMRALRKREAAVGRKIIANKAFKGQILLLSNSVPAHLSRRRYELLRAPSP